MANIPLAGEILSVAAAVCWAVGVVLFKKSGEALPPASLNLFKNVVAILLLLPTLPWFGVSYFPGDQPPEAWVRLIVSGVIGIAIADTLFFVALEKLGAGLTAVVDTCYTPLMLFLSYVVLVEQIGIPVYVGAALIVGGMLIGSLTRLPPGKTRQDLVLGTLIGVTSVALMAISIVMIKGVLNHAPALWATWIRLLAGVVGLIPMIALSRRRVQLIRAFKSKAILKYPLWAAVFGTYLAMMAWIGGMKYADVSVAATLNQLSTIFIFILAVAFLREPLTWRRVLAIGLAFTGGMLVVLRGLLKF